MDDPSKRRERLSKLRQDIMEKKNATTMGILDNLVDMKKTYTRLGESLSSSPPRSPGMIHTHMYIIHILQTLVHVLLLIHYSSSLILNNYMLFIIYHSSFFSSCLFSLLELNRNRPSSTDIKLSTTSPLNADKASLSPSPSPSPYSTPKDLSVPISPSPTPSPAFSSSPTNSPLVPSPSPFKNSPNLPSSPLLDREATQKNRVDLNAHPTQEPASFVFVNKYSSRFLLSLSFSCSPLFSCSFFSFFSHMLLVVKAETTLLQMGLLLVLLFLSPMK